jgi:hypothetical protein
MSYFGQADDQKGAFGELITAHKTPIVQIANKYQIDPANLDVIEVFSATSGTVDNSGNLFRCQTGTAVGGYGVVRSKDTLNYRAGQGVECQITAAFTTGVANSLQFAGMFSLTETLAFGYDGASFSVLHSYGGVAEVQLITVTATPSGTENTTVTLDGDGVTISVTNSTVQTNAEEIRAGLDADATVSAKWRFEQVDDKVYCISKSVGDKTGTFSILTSTMAASIAEQTAGVAKTDNHVAQASWNVDTSPITGFDPTKLNLYKIQYGYLGIANITFSIYNPSTAKYVKVHQIEWGNNYNVTHLGSPNLKVGWTAASLGSTTALTVTGASGSLMLEGDEIVKNNTFADEDTVASVSTTLTNLLTIKNRIVYGDRFNLGKIFPLRVSVDNDHNKGAIVEIFRNATLAGTTNYQYEDEYNSLALVDKSGTTVTGGTLIDAFTVAANGSESVDLTNLFTEMLPEDTFTIAAKTISGTSTAMTATISWKEEK